jgi:hypothetical protein
MSTLKALFNLNTLDKRNIMPTFYLYEYCVMILIECINYSMSNKIVDTYLYVSDDLLYDSSIRSEADKITNSYDEDVDDSVTKKLQRQNIANEQANPNITLVNTQMVTYWSSKQNGNLSRITHNAYNRTLTNNQFDNKLLIYHYNLDDSVTNSH